MKIGGIYKIVNKINNKYYIGSTNDINGRWRSHKSHLNRNIHKNIYLQREWNKYKENNFEFSIIEQIFDNQLLESIEQKYLDSSLKDKKHKCYNLSFISNRIEMTDEVCEKIRKKHIGKHHSEETKLKMRNSHIGKHNGPRKPHSIETKKKLSKSDIYNFINLKTNEKFSGTCFEFRSKYIIHPSSISALIKGRMKTLYNWKLI